MKDEDLRDALRADLHSRWKGKLQRLEQEPGSFSVRRRSLLPWAIAAVVALAIGLSTWLLVSTPSSATPQQLAQAYFEAPPNTLQPSVRGEEPGDALSRALYYYDTEQYDKASAAFERLAQQEKLRPDINIFLGVSYLANGQSQKAIEVLKRSHIVFSTWYLGLAYLQNGEVDKGIGALEMLLDLSPNDSFSEKAEALLKELEKN